MTRLRTTRFSHEMTSTLTATTSPPASTVTYSACKRASDSAVSERLGGVRAKGRKRAHLVAHVCGKVGLYGELVEDGLGLFAAVDDADGLFELVRVLGGIALQVGPLVGV